MKKVKFFAFGGRPLTSSMQAYPIDSIEDLYTIQDYCDLIKGVYSKFEFPIIFKQGDGKNLKDILDTGWPSRYLISSRLKELLESHSFTGWKSYPVKLYDKQSNEILGYHGFSILGKCARIDYKKSKIIEKQFVPNGPLRHYYKGITVDLDQWDGSDFFCPENSYAIFVTHTVGNVLKENKVTNLYLKDISEVEVNVNDVKK